MPVRHAATALVLAALGAAAMVGCSSAGDAGGGGVHVVASTDVWGSVTEQVAGSVKDVDVTSIITDPSADPHSYESDARTALAIKRADVVIENGGGYDDFMSTLRSSTGTKATVLDAVDISGKKAVNGELNEHVWYDFSTVRKVAQDIAGALAKADPAEARTFRANAATFSARLQSLQATEASIRAADAGKGVAITEPVPLYLLQACGLVNRTPQAFSQAIEDGSDVPVSVLDTTEQLFRSRSVSLLAYNEQTTGVETQQVLSIAKSSGVPVVPVTETLPDGKNYLSWMSANLAAVRTALATG